MLEQNQPQQRDIMHLHETGGEFVMGNFQSRIMQSGSLDKPAKTMMRKITALADLLQLPMRTHEDTHRALKRAFTNGESGDYFAETAIGEHTYFIHTRSPLDGRDIREIVRDKPPKLHIVTGPCLFSAHSALAISENGEAFSITDPQKDSEISNPVHRLQISAHLSIYEVDALTRLSPLIQSLAKDCPQVENIFLNIPHVEYYLYILDAFQNGHVTPQLALEWFDAVDKRFHKISSMMRTRIVKDIPQGIEIVQDTPLESIGQYIREMVSRGEQPDLEFAVTQLMRSSELFGDILSAKPPQTWRDLSYLGYVFSELRAGLSKNNDDRPTIAIPVENQTEMRIFNQAKVILQHLPDRGHHFNVIPLYTHEVVIPAGKENQDKNLYFVREVGSRRKNLYTTLVANSPRRKQL